MKYINLTQNQEAMIDDEDYQFVSQNKWCANKIKNNYYAIRTVIIRRQNKKENIKKKQLRIYMHTLILENKLERILKPNEEVHHINENGLDNRRENLMVVTRSQHKMLARKRKKYTSRHKGVSWAKRDKKWKVQITINWKQIYLGLFNSELEAAKAYDEAAKELFGEFAKLNFNKRSLDD